MKNFEKYEEEIKKLNYDFKVFKNKVLECDSYCEECDFYSDYCSCCINLMK